MKPAMLLLATALAATAFIADAVQASSHRAKMDPSLAGRAECPCIGIQNSTGVLEIKVQDAVVRYPGDGGSYCAAWDDGRNQDFCVEGQSPGKGEGFCAKKWCWVDACNCKGIDTPPKASGSQVAYQGKPIYYSYATCGEEDVWTEDHHPKACVNAKTEKDCMRHNDGGCMWGKTHFGEEDLCVGWEASGMCPGLPEASFWGRRECPCVGFIGGEGYQELDRGHGPNNYSASVGAICKPWDHFVHPECMGDKQPEWCTAEWCLVDPNHCGTEGSFVPPWLEAEFQGHPLHVSYETCGHKAPNRWDTTTPAPTTTTTSTRAPTTISTTTRAPTTTTTTTRAPATTVSPTEAADAEQGEDLGDGTEHDAGADEASVADSDKDPTSDSNPPRAAAIDDHHKHHDDDHDDDVDHAHDDNHDDDDDQVPVRRQPHRRAFKRRAGADYFDDDAYDAEWHNEWAHGDYPTWRR